MQHFCFPACREKGSQQWTPKVNDIKGCMTLGHSNETSCSLWNLLSIAKFPLFKKPDAKFPFSACNMLVCPRQRRAAATARPPVHCPLILLGPQSRGSRRDGGFKVHTISFCEIGFHFINKSHAGFLFSCKQKQAQGKGQPIFEPKSAWWQGMHRWLFKLDQLESTKPIFTK